MELVNSLISIIHILSASLSIFFGGWVLCKKKGTSKHKKIGFYYFIAMLFNNITALMIYNAFNEWFFPHWLAVATLSLLIPGYYVSKIKNSLFAMKVHIVAMICSYYFLIGGAVNEAFLHIPYLSQFMLLENPSPLNISHRIVLVLFLLIIIWNLIKYRHFFFPQTKNPQDPLERS
jgi:uncharacterized membrane protein